MDFPFVANFAECPTLDCNPVETSISNKKNKPCYIQDQDRNTHIKDTNFFENSEKVKLTNQNKNFFENSEKSKLISDKRHIEEKCDRILTENKSVNNNDRKSSKNLNVSSLACKKCNKLFSLKRALKKHSEIHDEKKYECKICHKKFHYMHNFQRHEKTHTGEKNFGCRFCDMKFIQSNTRNYHESAVHR